MSKAFSSFRGMDNKANTNMIWQQIDTRFPYTCDVCRRTFENGGLRFIASSLVRLSHSASACHCPDCHAGINPFRVKTPKLSERRTTLD